MKKKPSYEELERKVSAYQDLELRLNETERLLEESHQRFQSFLDHAPVGIGIFDNGFRSVYLNKPLREMSGRSVRQHIGRKIDDVLPEAAPVMRPLFEKILSTNRPVTNVELSCELPSGRGGIRYFLVSCFPMGVSPGHGPYIGAVVVDISERKSAEAILKMNEEKMSSIFRAAPIGIGVVSDRVFVEANDLFCKMIGYSKEELQGQEARFLYETEEEYRRIGRLQKKMKAGGMESIETRLKRKTGELIDVLVNYAGLTGDTEPGQMSFTALDITQKKAADKDLRETKRRLSTLIGNLPGMVYRCQNDPDWTMEYVSPGCVRLTGWSVSDLTGNKTLSFGNLIHPDDRDMVWQKIQTALERRDSFKIIYRIRTAENLEKWVLEQGEGIFDTSSNPIALEGFITDITEQKKLEEKIRQSTKLEAIGTLAGGIAHDFNNILFPIVGFAEMLKEDLEYDRELGKKVDQILTASNRAKEMIKQILSFSRQTKTHVKRLQPHLIVTEATKLIRAGIPSSIGIKQNIDSKAWAVNADPTEFHQVVMNLMTNAFQAMEEEGGTITVELENVMPEHMEQILSGSEKKRFVRLSVGDTGMGIHPDIENRIFDPYFTTKTDKKGTGLGLSTVHGIVKSMDGHVRMKTRRGKGTRFDIYLPAQPSPFSARKKHANGDGGAGNEKILLVDDELPILRTLEGMLIRSGYRVDTRDSSLDALELIKSDPGAFDLVLSDLTMPNMKGDELAEKIVQIRPDMPVIICTGYNYLQSLHGLTSKSIKAVIQKPVSTKLLTGSIRKVLDRTEKGSNKRKEK